jgi:hypothetical protein
MAPKLWLFRVSCLSCKEELWFSYFSCLKRISICTSMKGFQLLLRHSKIQHLLHTYAEIFASKVN